MPSLATRIIFSCGTNYTWPALTWQDSSVGLSEPPPGAPALPLCLGLPASPITPRAHTQPSVIFGPGTGAHMSVEQLTVQGPGKSSLYPGRSAG